MNTFLISGFYSDFQTDLIINAIAKDKYNKVDIWITKETQFKYIRSKSCVRELLDNHDCIRGINFSPNEDKKFNFKKLIKFSEQFSTTFSKMMTRFDPNDIYDEKYRKNHFHFLLKNWALKIIKRKINVALFFVNPHTLFDYAIYVVCKYLKIKIIIQEDTKYLAGAFFTKSIEGLSLIAKNHKKISPKNITKKTKTFIESNQILSTVRYNGDVEALSEMPYDHEVSFSRIFYWTFVKPFVKNKLNLFQIYKYFFKKQKRAVWNYSKYHYYDKRSMPTHFQDQYYYFKKNYLLKSLQRSYNRLSIIPSFYHNYVVFYDSINPEKSVVPDAVIFSNTMKILKEIRKYIPVSWHIYYKEHPAAYSLHYETHLSKKVKFYEDICKIPNLLLVKINYDKKKLLMNSKFTITRTGEVGFQSVVNNIPSLNLGNAWYSSCYGVIHLKKLEEIKKGIKLILKIKNIKLEKIKSFLNKLEKDTFDISFKGVNINWMQYPGLKNKKSFKKKFKILVKNFREKIPI